MGRYLLTGAGFSYNWGAPLARSLWTMIYNNKAVQDNNNCHRRLQNNTNFEAVYAEIIESEDTEAREIIVEALKEAYQVIDNNIIQILYFDIREN